ncbi:MAG: HAMP domain-containing sensor histidine kinase [Alphaproteobacteria bacterium]|nr:HAMP domain-containing sensor histidine kinase [Alphaproteobacteria bacterium]
MAGEKRFILPIWTRSLSARVLLLTVFFVMLAEILIYVPSLANFRINWLEDKIAAAHLAVLTLELSPERQPRAPVRAELLDRLNAYAIVVRRFDQRLLIYDEQPPSVDTTTLLDESKGLVSIRDALATLGRIENRIVRLVGSDPDTPDLEVEVIFDEADLRGDMLIYSRNILVLSLAISAIAGGLLYASLQSLMVRPMRLMTEAVTEFAENPEDGRTGVKPTKREDEIGVAQKVLAEMQDEVRASLRQKEHLATLGSAVSKINHDLRGILSTAVLVSDRLALVEDPEVKRISPPLIQAIDRAINLCTQTLNYARDGGPQLTRARFRLTELVVDVANDFAVFESGLASVANKIGNEMIVEADRDQLYRVLANLARNAFESGAYNVEISATEKGPDNLSKGGRLKNSGQILIKVADDGPGMSQLSVAGLFKPFASSTKPRGTGLGLTIARDVMRAHGGDIELVETNNQGTVFQLVLPV